MDHTHYEYSALPQRPVWALGQGRLIAAYAVLHLEHWELQPPTDALRDPRLVGEFGSFDPDFRSYTQREYGLRIGIFRVIDALREAGIRPCVAANAMALERLPQLVRLFNDWGCEWIAHGIASNRMMHSKMTPAQQRACIEASAQAVERACGRRPAGWLSQDWGTTPDTFALLADAGFTYTLDWPNDDQPYWLGTTPRLLAVPMSAEWDDVQCQWLRHIEPRLHTQMVQDALARMLDECARSGRSAVFGLGIHPWVSGMASRIAAHRQLLTAARHDARVHWTSPGQIHAAFAAQAPA